LNFVVFAWFGKTTLVSEWIADCGKPVAGCRWMKATTLRVGPDTFVARANNENRGVFYD
jgi:hypothetical protein